jgi:hypothetical protein
MMDMIIGYMKRLSRDKNMEGPQKAKEQECTIEVETLPLQQNSVLLQRGIFIIPTMRIYTKLMMRNQKLSKTRRFYKG